MTQNSVSVISLCLVIQVTKDLTLQFILLNYLCLDLCHSLFLGLFYYFLFLPRLI